MQDGNNFFGRGMNEWCTPFIVSEPVLDDASYFLSLILFCHGRFISDSWSITKILNPIHVCSWADFFFFQIFLQIFFCLPPYVKYTKSMKLVVLLS